MITTGQKKNIPKGWVEKRLGDLGDTYGGLRGKTKKDFGIGKPFIPYMNIFKNTYIDDQNFNFVNILENEKQNVVKYGDIFFTTSSETPNEVGMSSVYLGNNKELYLNSFCFGLRLKNAKVLNPKFSGFLFRSPEARKKISNLAQGSTRFNLSKKYFLNLSLLIPENTKEQQKIAKILETVDKEMEKTDEIIEKTEKLKKGLMQKLFEKKKGWDDINFGDICDLVKDKFNPKNDDDNFIYIGLEHVGQGTGLLLNTGQSDETLSIKTIFKKGDVLFGKLRPYLKKYHLVSFKGVCSTEIMVFRSKKDIDNRFLFYIIQRDDFIKNSNSKSFGTKMPRTDWKIIKSFGLSIPSLPEQQKIVEILSAVDEKISVNKKLKEKLTQLKKGLMQDLLSGRVRVNI